MSLPDRWRRRPARVGEAASKERGYLSWILFPCPDLLQECRGELEPVVTQNSCSMIPFSFFRARRYRRTSLPTCCFSCIDNAIMLLLSHMLTQGRQHHGHLPFFHDELRQCNAASCACYPSRYNPGESTASRRPGPHQETRPVPPHSEERRGLASLPDFEVILI